IEWEKSIKEACQKQPGKARARKTKGDTKSHATSGNAWSKVKGFLTSAFEKRAFPGAIPMLLISPAFGFGITYTGILGNTLDIANTSLFFIIGAIVMIIVRLSSGAFMDRIRPIKIFTVSVISGLVSFTILLLCSAAGFGEMNALLFYIAAAFYGLCLGLAMPTNQTVSVKNSPPERWGAANALFLLAMDLGIGFGSMLWGFVNEAFGINISLVCILVFLAVSFVCAFFIYPKNINAEPAEPDGK
ncbi:MAG: MFS transporter, partial [Eggerthellaceae bacterium]|nr:MFS transporter [Eggerthellaceae bacterium]